MDQNRQIPLSLKVVAILFLLGGIFAILEVFVAFTQNRISINLGVLGVFIGPGLLALRPGWRTCALVFLWIGMIGMPLIAILMLSHSGPLDIGVFGHKVGNASKGFGLVFAIILFLFTVWQYWVLTRPDVRRLFGVETF